VSEIRHPEAARLLAWVDGELNPLRAWSVRRHVRGCWQCRARVASLESAIGTVGHVLGEPGVEALDVAKARWRFRAAAAEVERSLEPRRGRRLPSVAVAATAMAAGIAFLAWRPTVPPTTPEHAAARMLDVALAAETPVLRAAVREERFTVEYRGTSGTPARRELRVLSSPKRGAWTARWSTEAGDLQTAIYAREAREFTKSGGLRPAVFRAGGGHRALYAYVSDDSEDIERAILRWIRSQAWQSVSFARELAAFCTRSGAVLQIAADGSAVLWTAESAIDGTRYRIHLEGSRNRAPEVLRVAWQSARGSGTIRLKREWRRDYDDVRLAAALLYPPVAGHLSFRHEQRAPLPDSAMPLPQEPALRELLATEVMVLHALHAAALCKADEVRVTRESHAVVVSGGFIDAEGIDTVTALLAGIPHVRLALRKLDVPPLPSLSATPATLEKQMRPAAAEPWLRTRLGVGTRTSERDMFNTMSAVVRDSEDLLSDSWALFRLSLRFPPDLESEMEPDVRNTLHRIVDDHLVAMSVSLAAIDGRLALQHSANTETADGRVWQLRSGDLHERAKHTAEVLLGLFAAGDKVRTAPVANPEQVGVAALIAHVRAMAAQVRADLGSATQAVRR
jgi:hypothetical protein